MSEPDKNIPLTCLVISDGRRGIENQALGLAEALGRLQETEITKHIVTASSTFKALPPHMQFKLKSKPADYGIKRTPNIAIGCGRQAIAPLMALKKAHGTDIFTVYVQDPRIDPKHFDLVIAPEHDGLSGANVISMIGSPNRITKERLDAEVQTFAVQLAKLPHPRVAVLIGGTSKSHKLTLDIAIQHMNAVCDLIEQGFSVMITTSRRTQDWVIEDYRNMVAGHKSMWLWDSQNPDAHENPYFAFLGGADAILVTEDSTNMLTEACATGKPVFTLPMTGDAGKFAALYESLKRRCHVVPFAGNIAAEPYAALDETSRMVKKLTVKIDDLDGG